MTDKVKPLSDDALREIEVLLVRYDGIDRKLCGKDTAEGVTERLRHNEIKAEIATVENVRSLYATVRVLRDWKESALVFLTRYDAIAETFGGKLGSSKVENLERGVAALREQLSEAYTWIDRKNAAIETWQQEAKENATQLAQVTQEQWAAVQALKDIRRIVGAPEIGADTTAWIDDIISKASNHEQPQH